METASTYIKGKGLPSLQYVSTESTISRSTLNGWWHTDRTKFETVVDGCLYRLDSKQTVTVHINGIGLDIEAESIKRAFKWHQTK
jgi:hypothetical protein